MPERLNKQIGECIVKKTLTDLQEYVNDIATAYTYRDAYRYIKDDKIVRKTYKQFANDIFAVASWLTCRGWEKKHIAIVGSTSYEWVVTFLGIACSGNVVVPIDRMLPEEDILGLLQMGDVNAVFLSAEYMSLKHSIEQSDNKVYDIIGFDESRFADILATEQVQLPKIDPDAMAEILFTSGTTGVSKGVMISQRSIVANICDIYRMNYGAGIKYPVVMSVLPIHHTFELTVDNLGVMYCGATVCINDKLENIVANLSRFRPNVILIVPAIAEVFYKKVKEGIAKGSVHRKIKLAKKINKLLRRLGIDARRVWPA